MQTPMPAPEQPVLRHDGFREDRCSVTDFTAQIAAGTQAQRIEFADSTPHGVPLYNCAALSNLLDDHETRAPLLAEWVHVLRDGAGVMVLQQAYSDTAPLDEATALFETIIRDERAQGGAGADHFAKAGANDRIWNAAHQLVL